MQNHPLVKIRKARGKAVHFHNQYVNTSGARNAGECNVFPIPNNAISIDTEYQVAADR